MLQYIIDIIYPDLCVYCDARFTKGETLLCTECKLQLPILDYHLHPDNPLMLKFEGRIPVVQAYAYLSFHKFNITQDLIHQLKYQHQKRIGNILGKWFGHSIYNNLLNSNVDIIIPVPIHNKKLKKRGFNQSDCIANGISKSSNIPISYKALVRKQKTTTQTSKSRIERMQNVQSVFKVKHPDVIKDKHVLLVDDVVTTGATMEACGALLLKSGAAKISVATLSVAK